MPSIIPPTPSISLSAAHLRHLLSTLHTAQSYRKTTLSPLHPNPTSSSSPTSPTLIRRIPHLSALLRLLLHIYLHLIHHPSNPHLPIQTDTAEITFTVSQTPITPSAAPSGTTSVTSMDMSISPSVDPSLPGTSVTFVILPCLWGVVRDPALPLPHPLPPRDLVAGRADEEGGIKDGKEDWDFQMIFCDLPFLEEVGGGLFEVVVVVANRGDLERLFSGPGGWEGVDLEIVGGVERRVAENGGEVWVLEGIVL